MVKHVVKSHFRPAFMRSQGRKVLEPQWVFGLWILAETSGRSAPKPGALPTGPHPEILMIVPQPERHHAQGNKMYFRPRCPRSQVIKFLWNYCQQKKTVIQCTQRGCRNEKLQFVAGEIEADCLRDDAGGSPWGCVFSRSPAAADWAAIVPDLLFPAG